MVGLAFISLFIQAGTGGFSFGIFLPAMNADLGWSRSTIVVASSLTSITSALMGPLIGRVVDRHGPRTVLIVSLLLMGFSIFISGLVTEPWHLYLSFGLMSGAARSALQSVVPGVMIANWFQRRRSAAYGLAAMGPPISNFVLPPLLAALVAAMGWRAGWMGLAGVGLALGLLPALLLIHRRPEDIGLRLDGDPPEAKLADGAPAPPKPTGRTEDWTAREAIHHPGFWLVAAAMSLILIAPNVSIVFMYSYLSSKGMDPAVAAVALSAVSGMQVVSRMVFWAPISARVNSVRWMLVFWGGVLLCATLLLAFADGELGAYAAAAVLGIGLGGNLVLQLQVWPEYFGRTALGTILGTSHLFQGITSATIPLLLAALLDATNDYTQLFLIVAVLVFLGLMLHLVVGRPRRPTTTGTPAPAA